MDDPVRPDSAGHHDEHLLRRIRGEYLEMPGLRLTLQQAQRLWDIDERTSARLLRLLVELKFLVCGSGGTYARLTEGTLPDLPLRMAKSGFDVAANEPVRKRETA